ncbi:hypothetical protein FOZ63_029617 [Perkinsus olseni]|uniref:ATP-dependent DNA helicase n=1 Tax=Perkinsus olseni TaxID=32597 RepID=A0A7J6UJF3_PEROL|nr:hypothetical protein FOZ63_029617 [Perkinsus olseni]
MATSSLVCDDASVEHLKAVAKAVFGFDALKQEQVEVMQALMKNHKDVFYAFPTGGGKSLCYQLPALASSRPGFALIVSPLIALMQDQLHKLREVLSSSLNDHPQNRFGPSSCAVLNSSISPAEREVLLQDLQLETPATRIVYITPEQISSEAFKLILGKVAANKTLLYAAIDEAHCISQWGHDFRPAYRRLRIFRDLCPGVPLLACTATSTPKVRDDVIDSLRMNDPKIVSMSFDRPNLAYSIVFKGDDDDGMDKIVHVVREAQVDGPDSTGLVYCFRRADCEKVASRLQGAGIKAGAYHAGMPDKQRAKIQNDWLKGGPQAPRVLCATIAFGMGVDKANVRFVIHMTLSKTIEGYYQESGRAGRDGKPAKCVLLYSNNDAGLLRWFIGKKFEDIRKKKKEKAEEWKGWNPRQLEEQERRELEAFDLFTTYATKASCRREFLLGHFGEKLASRRGPSRKQQCCDYCSDPSAVQQATQKALHRNRGGLRTHPSLATPAKRPFNYEYDNRSTSSSVGYFKRCRSESSSSSRSPLSSEVSRVAARAKRGGTISMLGALMRAEEKASTNSKAGHRRSLRERFR